MAMKVEDSPHEDRTGKAITVSVKKEPRFDYLDK
jgi:hypothetical protein